eukprot:SAG11_NODE_23167_length_394_cov_0.349153_1_plen_96_part_01
MENPDSGRMPPPPPRQNPAAAPARGSAVAARPPSPGVRLIGEQAQLQRLKDSMEKVLGSRLNKRQGLTSEHYEVFQRALCGVSLDPDFGVIDVAWR